MNMVGCPFCGTGNRLGKATCKKCSRPIPQVEDIIKPKKKVKKVKSKSLDMPKFDVNGLPEIDDNLMED